jgi:hypothetical protein
MGLIAKAATKQRVQPLSGPVNAALTGTPWLTTGVYLSARWSARPYFRWI